MDPRCPVTLTSAARARAVIYLSVCCFDERIRLCRRERVTGGLGITVPFSDDSSFLPGNNQTNGDLSDVDSVDSSRAVLHLMTP